MSIYSHLDYYHRNERHPLAREQPSMIDVRLENGTDARNDDELR